MSQVQSFEANLIFSNSPDNNEEYMMIHKNSDELSDSTMQFSLDENKLKELRIFQWFLQKNIEQGDPEELITSHFKQRKQQITNKIISNDEKILKSSKLQQKRKLLRKITIDL